MIIVDSNVWADFFNGAVTPHVNRLVETIQREEDLAVLPLIITEVLQGFRSDRGFHRARRIRLELPVIEPTLECHVRAAWLFRRLRLQGVTIRGAVDCLIAQTCLDAKAELLSPDADFEQIARHTPLRLWAHKPD